MKSPPNPNRYIIGKGGEKRRLIFMKKGYIKRGGVIVSMYGDVICDKEDCPFIDDIGNCTNINAKCENEKQRN